MIKVNGNIISGNFAGRNINMSNDKVFIDGVEIQTEDQKIVNIEITGDVASIYGPFAKVYVKGNVTRNIETLSGDVNCGNIGGDVGTVSGDVNVDGIVSGSVKTVSGDIKYNWRH